MNELIAENPDLIINQFREILNISRQVKTVDSNTKTSEILEPQLNLESNPETLDMKNSGFNKMEVLHKNSKLRRNVIFFQFGFFTLRVLPRKGYASLLRFFF